MDERFDAIVIGTGQSGPALARDLAAAGRSVAVIERKSFGGSCVNFGCVPTKAYVASARAAHVARTAQDLGVEIRGEIVVDLARVKQRKDELVISSSGGVEKSLRDENNITVIEGHGRFVGPRRVKVGERELEAKTVIINTGARAAAPKIDGLNDVPWLTATDMLELTELPEHLVIIGGGYIGVEFSQMFRRFGSAVTILQRDERLLPNEDEDISDAVREILEAEGINVRTGAAPSRVAPGRKGVDITLQGEALEASHLLIAAGRQPNTDDLGLAEAGVKTDKRGFVEVDDQLRTSAEGVFALGDCNGRGAFTHTSFHDYQVARDALIGEGKRRLSDRIPCHGVFLDPPLGRVGMNEREARATGKRLLKATMPMSRVGRAGERGETQGFMKALADAESGRLLGAAILGINGDEAIHCFADIMYAGADYRVLRDAVHIHPTVAELLPTLLQGLKPVEE
jgi:pyruvate/2-oxoglutarate dehydrogenase complex dihydrolipoamide dehydrogenase (E3) component